MTSWATLQLVRQDSSSSSFFIKFFCFSFVSLFGLGLGISFKFAFDVGVARAEGRCQEMRRQWDRNARIHSIKTF